MFDAPRDPSVDSPVRERTSGVNVQAAGVPRRRRRPIRALRWRCGERCGHRTDRGSQVLSAGTGGDASSDGPCARCTAPGGDPGRVPTSLARCDRIS